MDPTDPQGFGQAFISRLLVGLLIAVVVYVVGHLVVTNPHVGWDMFAIRSDSGEVTFKNLDALDWYVGMDRAEPTLRTIRDRNAQIVDGITHLRADLHGVSNQFSQAAVVAALEGQIRKGAYTDAFVSLDQVTSSLSLETRRSLNIAAIGDRLLDLQHLATAQLGTLQDLTPPSEQMFFWTTPSTSMLEVLAWALFGVITNLLVNSAEYQRKGEFQPAERYVAYTKLVYGPILAMVMVLAIRFGWLDLGPYKARVWTLPLVAFVFGYAARRTATLFDALQDKVFGAAEKSVAEGPQKTLDEQRKKLDLLLAAAQPVNISDLRDAAKQIAHNQVSLSSTGG